MASGQPALAAPPALPSGHVQEGQVSPRLQTPSEA